MTPETIKSFLGKQNLMIDIVEFELLEYENHEFRMKKDTYRN